MNATLTLTSNGQTVIGTITDESGAVLDTFSVKDGNGLIRRIDRKVCNELLWNRSGFDATMTATLTRSATYRVLTAMNAR